MELKILDSCLEKITEDGIEIKRDFEFSEICDDKISMAYNKGVLKGLDIALQILYDMRDKEIETMAANMEGEKR